MANDTLTNVPAVHAKRQPVNWLRWMLALPAILFFTVNAALICCLFIGVGLFPLIGPVYTFNTLVLPAVIVIICLLLWVEWRKAQHRNLARAIALRLGIASLLFGTRVYATHIEPNRLVIHRVTIRTPKLDKPLRILHITDIQTAAIGAHEERAFAAMRELKPDLIVHTGDMLQTVRPATFEGEQPKLAQLFSTLKPAYGLFGVYGDTDREAHGRTTQQWGGLRLLESQATRVKVGGKHLNILGLSLRQSRFLHEARPVIEGWFKAAKLQDFNLVIGHAPDYVLTAKQLPIDLCLAGHTHGGQIRIPFFGPLLTLSTVPREWARGYRTVGKTHLNVSAGIGAEHALELPSIRLNCPPEMTLIELQPDRK